MIKKKLLFVTFLLLIAMSMSARSMREMWLSMPDSIIPYLNRSMRTELVNLADVKAKDGINNLLKEKSVIDTLSERYLSVTVSGSSQVQMRLLPSAEGDSILCMVSTFKGPEPESEIRFYSFDWKELDMRHCFMDGKCINEVKKTLVVKPDTMSQERFAELKKMLDPLIASARLSADNDTLVLSLSVPMLSEEERWQVNSIILQRKLNWDGRTFN